jgi:hypothetical protein
MTEPPSGNWLLDHILEMYVGINTMIAGALEYMRRRIDAVRDRQGEFVTRAELSEMLENERDDSARKHSDNIRVIENLSQRIDRVLERL